MVDPKSGKYDLLPHVAPGNIESFTGRLYDNVKLVGEENLISGKFVFNVGDIVYGKINPQLGKYVFARFSGLTSADAYVLNAKNGIVQKFLYAVIQTRDFYDYSVSVSKRSGMPKINRDELNAYSYWAPSESEQLKIGEYLLTLDHLITLHQRQPFLHSPPDISLIVQLTPPFYTFSWEQRKLGELVDVCSGRDYKHLSEGTIPVYGTGGYMLSVNDALSYDRDAIGIGRKGTIDRPYILKAPFWTVDTLFYAIPREKVDLNYAFDIFQNIDWKKKDESTGVPSLSKTAINDIDVLAPKHDEQQIIGQFFAAIDNLITLHQRQTIVYAVIRSIRKVILAERQYFAPPMVRKSP